MLRSAAKGPPGANLFVVRKLRPDMSGGDGNDRMNDNWRSGKSKLSESAVEFKWHSEIFWMGLGMAPFEVGATYPSWLKSEDVTTIKKICGAWGGSCYCGSATSAVAKCTEAMPHLEFTYETTGDDCPSMCMTGAWKILKVTPKSAFVVAAPVDMTQDRS